MSDDNPSNSVSEIYRFPQGTEEKRFAGRAAAARKGVNACRGALEREQGLARLSAFLNEPSDDVLVEEAEEWNRQMQALDERRNSYERLLRGMVQRSDRRRPRRER